MNRPHLDALSALPHSASLLVGGTDTIVARATAEGRGALAVIRLSGAAVRDIATALAIGPLGVRVATRVTLRHPTDATILDDAIATYFAAPHSYTGEDVLELSTHGGQVVPSLVVRACVAAGARVALPGEFSRRAVVNGRMDLMQAEAVADLIDARTLGMHAQALSQLDGGLSRRFLALRDDVIGLESLLAYDIDFPGEDDGPIDPARIRERATALLTSLDALLATAPRAAVQRDGALVVIAGPPNVGKSSLFNALLGESRALVTAIAGTTRDAIEAVLDRRPVPLRLVDTAGLRDTDDVIERLGIAVSTRYLANARVVLACGSTAREVQTTLDFLRGSTDARIVPVHTKADLRPASVSDADAAHAIPAEWHPVSAESGVGLAGLLSTLDTLLRYETDAAPSDIMVTRERHRAGLADARAEIATFLEAWEHATLPLTVVAVHLQTARDALASVVGVIGTEDVLDRVFRDFCIGK